MSVARRLVLVRHLILEFRFAAPNRTYIERGSREKAVGCTVENLLVAS
jgi:hypothetical protein